MEFLNNKLIKYKFSKNRDYSYNFLDLIDDSFETRYIYDYLLSTIEYKLKNIWNSIVKDWDNSNMEYKNTKNIYLNQSYDYIHTLITDTELNNLLNQFIDNDQFKALYAILSIQNQI